MRLSLRRSAGMTAVEMAVSTGVLSVVLFSAAVTSNRTFTASSDMIRRTNAMDKAQAAADAIAAALADAGASTVSINASHTEIVFRAAAGYTGGSTAWKSQQRIRWKRATPGSGGTAGTRVGSVSWTRDLDLPTEATTVLASNVPALAPGEIVNGLDDNGDGLIDEAGLTLENVGGSIRVRLTVLAKNADGEVRNTATRIVALRN